MAERGDVDQIRVGRVDADLRDDLRVGEADVRPGLAGVGRLVGPAALDDVAAKLGFAGADVDDVRVRLGDGDGADRRVVDLAVRHRLPGDAAVGRLPQAAAGRAHVGLVRPRRAAGDRNRPAAARRTEAAPAQRAEGSRGYRLGRSAAPLGADERGIENRSADGKARQQTPERI